MQKTASFQKTKSRSLDVPPVEDVRGVASEELGSYNLVDQEQLKVARYYCTELC